MRRARSASSMIFASAARTTRSVLDMRGLGLARRSAATSCRSASISASLADEDRASSASQDSTATSSRYASATHAGADHADAVTPGQTSGPVFDHYSLSSRSANSPEASRTAGTAHQSMAAALWTLLHTQT